MTTTREVRPQIEGTISTPARPEPLVARAAMHQGVTYPVLAEPSGLVKSIKRKRSGAHIADLDRLYDLLQLDPAEVGFVSSTSPRFKSRGNFLDDINQVSKSWQTSRKDRFPNLLVFKNTSGVSQPGHPSDTASRPDIIAAFEPHWLDIRTVADSRTSASNRPKGETTAKLRTVAGNREAATKAGKVEHKRKAAAKAGKVANIRKPRVGTRTSVRIATQVTTAAGNGPKAATTASPESKPKAQDFNRRCYWPSMRLAGEDASKGKSEAAQLQQARTHLDYFLLARPDHKAGCSFLIKRDAMVILVGICGSGITHLSFPWNTDAVRRAARALVERLYDPGPWLDPDITMVYRHGEANPCTYTIHLDPAARREPGPVGEADRREGGAGNAPGNALAEAGQRATERESVAYYTCMYSAASFATRTHVLFYNPPKSHSPDSREIEMPVFKKQLCRSDTRFKEIETLDHSHALGQVPGVVAFVYAKRTPSILAKGREDVCLGLKMQGLPFMSIKTPKRMLEVAYDILEVTRYLYTERSVLHRDISSGNALAAPEVGSEESSTLSPKEEGNEDKKTNAKFITALLSGGTLPNVPRALLIDFNRSQIQEGDSSSKQCGRDRTGTPLYMARAVQDGSPVELPSSANLVIPMPKPLALYQKLLPERCERFQTCETSTYTLQRGLDDARVGFEAPKGFAHALHHEAESTFWVMFHWAISAQPGAEEDSPQDIQDTEEGSLQDNRDTEQDVFQDDQDTEDIVQDEDEEDSEEDDWEDEEDPEEGIPEEPMESLIPSEVWTEFHTAEGKGKLIRSRFKGAFHPTYQPFTTLFATLAEFLQIDPCWFDTSDPRSHPDFIHECFQRIIFKFLVERKDEPFMDCKTSNVGRDVLERSFIPRLSMTTIDVIRAECASVSRPSTPQISETGSQAEDTSQTDDEHPPKRKNLTHSPRSYVSGAGGTIKII
ncbi:hypothetical protein BKA70DRAFT_1144384 [Coprinopsis sp. MPI-PUGE-AT-0042]|nr:hypothetical protein BKA70DRAFT_1144384 [Coprinopsis sp. MPI-PUGE-AT-0042]